jgi:hypothetical protein
MASEEARWPASLTFGTVAVVTEDTRAMRRWQRLEQLAQDTWYAIRIRQPVRGAVHSRT